ncbi:MAG: adenosylcobinamide amidohydrolase [Thermocladium sp.]
MIEYLGDIVKVSFGGELTSLSTTIMGGGLSKTQGAIFKTVPRDFNDDPDKETAAAVSRVGGGSWMVFLTAVDVNLAAVAEWSHGFTVATAGLEPPACIHTINVLTVAREPLNQEGLVDLFRTVVEAKSLAAIKLGLMCGDDVAVGTVSDAAAVAAILEEDGARFAGPGTAIGRAAASSVISAVMDAAIKWAASSGAAEAGFVDEKLMERYMLLIRQGLEVSRAKYVNYLTSPPWSGIARFNNG